MKRMQLFLILLTVGVGPAFSDDVIEVKTELVKELGNNVSMSSLFCTENKIIYYKHEHDYSGSAVMYDIDTEEIRDLSYKEMGVVFYSCPE